MARRVFQMRDKHLSTTNLYPKQIEQSLPKDVVPVTPEPEAYVPTGEEPEAEYITINNVTYKVGGGGTEVVANPTLAGTEADLTGLQVGDTKYKVPSGGSFTQEQADWTEADNTKPSYIKNKPNLATVATSGSYNDLINKPNIVTYNELMSTPMGSYSSLNNLDVIISARTNNSNPIEITGLCKKNSGGEEYVFTIRLIGTNTEEYNGETLIIDRLNQGFVLIYCWFTSGTNIRFQRVNYGIDGNTNPQQDYDAKILSVKEIINY